MRDICARSIVCQLLRTDDGTIRMLQTFHGLSRLTTMVAVTTSLLLQNFDQKLITKATLTIPRNMECLLFDTTLNF